MSERDRPLVVLGVGNVLRADDGVGVRVLERLASARAIGDGGLPPGVRLVDGGIDGLGLLPVVAGARGLVLVDAVRLGGEAGTVSILRGDAIAAAGGSADGAGDGAVRELLAVAELLGTLPADVAMVAVEVADLGSGLRLTPAVAAAVPVAAARVRDELRRMDDATATGRLDDTSTRLAGATA
jgi:hydrogenase maturation protease